MRRAWTAIVVVAVLFGAQVPPVARAAIVIHVPADYPTIQAAIDAAADGDTVIVAPGTYPESLQITESITLESSDGAEATTIDGVGMDPTVDIYTQGAETPTLRGFTITGGSATFGGGVYLLGAGTATIADNVIAGNYAGTSGGGIDINGGGSSVIERNVIKGNTSQQGGGISIVNALTPVIRNNLIAGNTASSGGGLYLSVPSGSTGPSIVNNTIVDNAGTSGPGISATGYDAATRIQNNIVIGSTAQATVDCRTGYDGAPPLLIGNDVLNPTGAEYDGLCAGTTGTGGNASVDPRFVDPAHGDYHLRADSPLIDAGQNPDAPTTDFDGDTRPLDGDEDGFAITDIGFDEAADPLLVDPGYVYFGNVDVGASAPETVTLTNLGSSSLSITSVAIGGTDAGDFAIAVPLDDTCTGAVLAVSADCHVTVRFAPSAFGDRTAVLTITGPGPVGTHQVRLDGVGLDPILVLGGPMAFGSVTLGTTSPAKTGEVNNYGAPVSITGVTLGGPAAGDFSVVDDTCSGFEIPTAQACTFGVRFTPKALGARTATLTISGPFPVGTRTIDLAGSGAAPPSGVTWSSAYAAGPAYTWNSGGALARTLNGTTQRLHLLYATDRVSGAWAGDSGPYAGVYYISSASGSTWTAPRRLNPSGQHAIRLGLAASGSRVYATWVSQTKIVKYSPSAPRVLYVRVNRSYGASTAWSSAIRLSSTSGRVDYPTIAAWGYDVYVAWTDSATGSVRLAISHDRGVTWKTVTLGTTSLSTSSGRTGLPSVAVSGSAVVVGWLANSSGALQIRHSADRGSHWNTAVTAASTTSGYFGVAIRGTRVALTWTTADDVMFRQRVAGTWSAPVAIAGLPSGTDPAPYAPVVAIQASNRIGVAWSEETSTPNYSNLRWIESPDGGSLWFQPQTLASSSTSSARRLNDFASVVWPSEGARYVVWNGWTAGTNSYRLFLRRGIGTPVGPTLAAGPAQDARASGPLSADLGDWRLRAEGPARR